jgi:hypothetical protein
MHDYMSVLALLRAHPVCIEAEEGLSLRGIA